MLCCILGESGSGKDTTVLSLMSYTECKKITPAYKRLVLVTDRPKRYYDLEGMEYYFYSKRYMDYLKRGAINVEVAEYREYKVQSGDVWGYATMKHDLLDALQSTDYYLVPCVIDQLTSYLNIANENSLYDKITAMVLHVNYNTRVLRALKRCDPENDEEVKETLRRQLYDKSSLDGLNIPKSMIIENHNMDKCLEDSDAYIKRVFSDATRKSKVEYSDIKSDYLDLYKN